LKAVHLAFPIYQNNTRQILKIRIRQTRLLNHFRINHGTIVTRRPIAHGIPDIFLESRAGTAPIGIYKNKGYIT
jgi:hypothetical protein